MPSPREIIEDIRKSEYGIGLPPDSPERVGFDKSQPIIDRCIQLLSETLNTEDIHFVLELVQNADDNGYQADVVPLLRFVRRDGLLLVQNNEIGFEEPNVRSLCDIGKSSKSKALGYIGEKGIGFKSVFRVSNEPHIVSNGYSFRFRREDPTTGLGFVIPEWVEAIPNFVDPSLTNIVLPLRHPAGEETQQIERLAPGLLLFLKKLKLIEVEDHVRGQSARHERIDYPDGVEIRSGSKKIRCRLVRQEFEVPPTIRDSKREDVPKSEVVLAFPTAEDGRANASEERQVYAYLPIRRYGFRFLIQADFVLASSRESILPNRPWNLWLRDQVAPVFLQAVEDFKQDEGGLKTQGF